ncbi:unnamed protein product [Arabidopsis lyrata]|nr:unnamed protein product [Arabidopsis lyrata]
MTSIPVDLIFDILSRLPEKSIARFLCVSKLWGSIVCGPYFTEMFLTRSLARPRLLFVVVRCDEWSFFSSPHPQNPYGKSSLVVAADFQMKLSKGVSRHSCSYANGLIYFPSMWISKEEYDEEVRMICNPSTGQYVILPKLLRRSEKFMFIEAKHFCDTSNAHLINYKGKLGGISLKYACDGGFPLELSMWVLEDVEKHEWSKYVYTLRAENKVVKVKNNLSVVGTTARGEIVLSKNKSNIIIDTIKPFYVFYFNPEKNTLLSVEIQDFGERHEWFMGHKVYAFVDHVEDLKFNIMKTTFAATSISPPEQKRKATSTSTSSIENHQMRTVAHLQKDRRTFESVNIFDVLCISDDDGSTGVKT